MISVFAPVYICVFADMFFDLYRNQAHSPTYNAMKMLFIYFMHEYESVSDMIRKNAWTQSESYFLFQISNMDGNRIMKRMRASILRRYKGSLNPDNLCLAIDDTDNPCYSKFLPGIQTWKSSKGYFHGQKVMVCALVDRTCEFALPLFFQFCTPKSSKDYKSGIERAFDLGMKAVNLGFIGLPVVADSWFDSEQLASKFKDEGVIFIWELKGSRNAKRSVDKNGQWKKLNEIFDNLARSIVGKKDNQKLISTRQLLLKAHRTKIKAVACYNEKRDKKAFAYYASTELTLSGARIWSLFRARWSIECLFRDLKSHLNLGKISTKYENVNELAFVIPFVILVYMRLKPGSFGLLPGQTVSTMIEKLKFRHEKETLKGLVSGAYKKSLEVIINRRKSINKKPTNKGPEALVA